MSEINPTESKQPETVAAARLAAEVRPVADLTPAERDSMYAIMSGHFLNVSRAQFLQDLSEKQSVVVMKDAAEGRLRGFSTIGRITATVDGQTVTGHFSGDTVIEPEFWGEHAWLSVWAAHSFAQADKLAPAPLYWVLLTATHRSYRLLANLFKEYYPRHDQPTPERVQSQLDALVRVKFPAEYDAGRGVVYLKNQTPVRPDRVDPATAERDAPEVRYFREANPGYASGDFLACMTRLSRDNITPLGRRVLGTN